MGIIYISDHMVCITINTAVYDGPLNLTTNHLNRSPNLTTNLTSLPQIFF
jgi:hypothetical protein